MTIQSLVKEHQVIIIIIIIIIITISLHPYYNKFVGSLSGSRGLGGFSITVCVSEHLTVFSFIRICGHCGNRNSIKCRQLKWAARGGHCFLKYPKLVEKTLFFLLVWNLVRPILKYTMTLYSFKISIHIPYTVLQPFPNVLTWRICLTIKSFFSWWSFAVQFSWTSCVIQRWYCKTLDTSHS